MEGAPVNFSTISFIEPPSLNLPSDLTRSRRACHVVSELLGFARVHSCNLLNDSFGRRDVACEHNLSKFTQNTPLAVAINPLLCT